jgi:hypothetical protein
MNNFYNSGFGWVCIECECDLKISSNVEKHGRLMREGESESKTPRFSTSAMAKWNDIEQRTLVCPRCNKTELVS